ncbi:MAG: hypothetical protein DMD91_07030 [Candidatus Rokuibacteriota bacterium]|nr:MAG: hypothetical protein DMD91_07030 [Candidatus Rokubacteria bacterium]
MVLDARDRGRPILSSDEPRVYAICHIDLTGTDWSNECRGRTKIDSLRAEPVSEICRLDTRIDGPDRELRTDLDVRERLAALEARRSP